MAILDLISGVLIGGAALLTLPLASIGPGRRRWLVLTGGLAVLACLQFFNFFIHVRGANTPVVSVSGAIALLLTSALLIVAVVLFRRLHANLLKSGSLHDEINRALDRIQESMFSFDVERKITSWNTALEQHLGWRGEDLRDAHVLELFPESEWARISAAFDQLRSVGHISLRTPLVTKAGDERQVSLSATLLQPDKSEDGEVVGFLLDITERVRAEAALKESEARYLDLLDNSPDMILSVRVTNQTVIYCNQTLADELGYPRDAILGKPLMQLIHPDSHEGADWAFREFLATGESHYAEYQILRKDGSAVDVSTSATAIRDTRGEILATRTVWRNITERKRAESALRISEQKLRILVETVPDHILLYDLEGRITYINRVAPEFKNQSVIGQPAKNFINLEYQDSWEYFFNKTIVSGESSRLELKAGVLEFTVTLLPIFTDEKVNSVLAVARDVTEQRRADNERRTLESALQHTQKLETIGRMAGGIAHDFNNILSPILGYADMAIQEVPPESRTKTDLEKIVRAAHRARRLVDQILSFSRQVEPERHAVDLAVVAEEALSLAELNAPAATTLICELPRNLPPILADSTQIHQVIVNLVTNAHDAMVDGDSAVLTVAARVATDEEVASIRNGTETGKRFLRLSVRDNGTGMDRETMRRVFEPFFTTKEIGKGSGMGLSVVHGIVKRHGGEIKIRSESGVGTEISILLPCHTIDNEANAQGLPLTPTGSERILLVDDVVEVANTGKEMLEQFGYSVTAESSGIDAIDLIRKDPGRYDLVVTDQRMPNIQGIELAVEVRRIQPGLPIILITGYAESVTEDRLNEAGIDRFIMKPLIPSELGAAVRQVLDRSRNADGDSARKEPQGTEA